MADMQLDAAALRDHDGDELGRHVVSYQVDMDDTLTVTLRRSQVVTLLWEEGVMGWRVRGGTGADAPIREEHPSQRLQGATELVVVSDTDGAVVTLVIEEGEVCR